MSKYSQEYNQLSKEYFACKKSLFTLLCLLFVFGMVPFIFRLIEGGEIFNISKDGFIGLVDFLSISGVVVTFLTLLIAIKEWVSIRKEMKSLR